MRASYDASKKRVLLREGCYLSHGTTRVNLLAAMEAAFAPQNYYAGLGQITTPDGAQNVTPDCLLASGPAAFPVLAEVGQSQSVEQLNQRANLLLTSVPRAHVVILVKIFDTAGPENGRLVAWCASLDDHTENVAFSARVEFGRTGPGGAQRVTWTAAGVTPVPFITVPPHGAVPATNVPLDGILTGLRAGGGAVFWRHPPAP